MNVIAEPRGPRAIALLVCEHPDGTRTTITTGEDWKVTDGPTVRNSVFLGEDFEVGPGPKFHVYLVPKGQIRSSGDLAGQKFVDLGFDRIYLHNVGRNQREWIDVFGRDVLPALAR